MSGLNQDFWCYHERQIRKEAGELCFFQRHSNWGYSKSLSSNEFHGSREMAYHSQRGAVVTESFTFPGSEFLHLEFYTEIVSFTTQKCEEVSGLIISQLKQDKHWNMKSQNWKTTECHHFPLQKKQKRPRRRMTCSASPSTGMWQRQWRLLESSEQEPWVSAMGSFA